MAANQYYLQSELHQQVESGFLATGYKPLITGMLDSGNNDDVVFIKNHIGREWFRRLANYGLDSYITDPYDAGYRPETITGLYYVAAGGGGGPNPNAPLDATNMYFWLSAQAVSGVANSGTVATVQDFANGGTWSFPYSDVKYIEEDANFDSHPSIRITGSAGVIAGLNNSAFTEDIVSGCTLFVVWRTRNAGAGHPSLIVSKNDTNLNKAFYIRQDNSLSTYGPRGGVMYRDTEFINTALSNGSYWFRLDYTAGPSDLSDFTRSDGAGISFNLNYGPSTIPTTNPQSGNADVFFNTVTSVVDMEFTDIIMFGPDASTSEKAQAEDYFYTGYGIAPA